jgi:hypothetical protein
MPARVFIHGFSNCQGAKHAKGRALVKDEEDLNRRSRRVTNGGIFKQTFDGSFA